MKLNAKNTALVLIDLQKGILGMPVQPHAPGVVYERSVHLAQRFRNVGALVVWVRVSFSSDFADAQRLPVDQPTNHAALPPGWDELPAPLPPSDLLITKRHWGAFYGTELDLQLRRRGIQTIVLGGVATNIGVESTARQAWEYGYAVVLAEDATSGMSAEMHYFAIDNIFPRISRVVKSAELNLSRA